MGTILRFGSALIALASVAALAQCSAGSSDSCGPADSDGLTGGSVTLDLSVSDSAFTPIILKAQNLATVTLRLKNTGARPHDFVVDCLSVPHAAACPATSCFPDAGATGPVDPGASTTITFVTPNPEGIYVFRSNLAGDTQTGQFVVQ